MREGSLVIGWRRMRWEGVGRGREWIRRGRKSNWEGAYWILVQEKDRE
jgi:hypothetical protein